MRFPRVEPKSVGMAVRELRGQVGRPGHLLQKRKAPPRTAPDVLAAAARRTAPDDEPVIYLTRELPRGYRDRLRLLALRLSARGKTVTMQRVLNRALAVALPVLEKEVHDTTDSH